VESSCEHGNEPSGSIKFWENLEHLSYWELLKKHSSPYILVVGWFVASYEWTHVLSATNFEFLNTRVQTYGHVCYTFMFLHDGKNGWYNMINIKITPRKENVKKPFVGYCLLQCDAV
jgi:hypothetical protein